MESASFGGTVDLQQLIGRELRALALPESLEAILEILVVDSRSDCLLLPGCQEREVAVRR
jgi:hypothetical protein